MNLENNSLPELIYNLVCGQINTEQIILPEGCVVKSEFEDGSECDADYERMLAAYSRLCERLNVEECNDADVEVIINALMNIGRHTARKMFDYGVLYGRGEQA